MGGKRHDSGLSQAFVKAATEALRIVAPGDLAAVGDWILDGVSMDGILEEFPLPEEAEVVGALLDAFEAENESWDAAAAYLNGLCDGVELARRYPGSR